MLPRRLGHCFGSLNTLTSKECSETGAFGHSCNCIVRSQKLRRYRRYEANFFFLKCLKFYVDSKTAIVNWEDVFGFQVNWVETSCVHFCLL